MTNYVALKALIDSDAGNAALTAQEVADWCNAAVVTRDRAILTTAEVYAAVAANPTEYAAMSNAQQQELRDIWASHSSTGIPTTAGGPVRTRLIAILGNSTKQALAAAIDETVSRATDAGIGSVRAGDVEYARTL